jgi:hypothetical protein
MIMSNSSICVTRKTKTHSPSSASRSPSRFPVEKASFSPFITIAVDINSGRIANKFLFSFSSFDPIAFPSASSSNT